MPMLIGKNGNTAIGSIVAWRGLISDKSIIDCFQVAWQVVLFIREA